MIRTDEQLAHSRPQPFAAEVRGDVSVRSGAACCRLRPCKPKDVENPGLVWRGGAGRGVLLPVRMLRWAFCSQDAVLAPCRCFMPHSCNLVKSGSKVETGSSLFVSVRLPCFHLKGFCSAQEVASAAYWQRRGDILKAFTSTRATMPRQPHKHHTETAQDHYHFPAVCCQH